MCQNLKETLRTILTEYLITMNASTKYSVHSTEYKKQA